MRSVTSVEELDRLAVLIQSYQRFYLDRCCDAREIRSHFSQLVPPSEKGFLLAAWESDSRPLGFCTVYILPSSLSCKTYPCLNDLFVEEDLRGSGIGRTLMLSASAECRRRGFGAMEWITKHDNLTSQKLYDTLTENRSLWYYYSMKTDFCEDPSDASSPCL
ncbi:MAG: N-acetyltransferase family protein [Bdellovibrionales bacterium]